MPRELTKSRARGGAVNRDLAERADRPAPSGEGAVSGWAVLGVILTAILFAGATVLISSFRPVTYSASARLVVRPDPTINDPTPALPSTDQNDIYMQTQVLAVQDFGPKVASGIDLSVSQVGQTNLLAITASADTTKVAVKAANDVLNAYVASRRAGVAAYAKSAAGAINDQLQSVSAQLASATGGAPDVSARRGALSSEYNRLVSLRNQLMLAATTAQPTTVINYASAAEVAKVTNTARNAFLAAVVGALIAVAVRFSSARVSWRRARSAGSTDRRRRSPQ